MYYDGGGTLLKREFSTGEYWEYSGIVYKNGQPYQTPIPEGRAVYQSSSWQYEFFYTDHLGNTRVSFSANGNQLLKSSDTAFDPWGVVLRGAGQENGVSNRFEYQDKEKESTFNLNRINLGARTYNPTIGRMDRVDSLAEIFPTVSSYSYAINNPVLFTDRFGLYAESSQEAIAICPTCPKDKKYDEYRDSKSLYTYDKETGIVLNGDGQGATVYGKRTQPTEAPTFGWPWQADLPIGVSEWHLGNKIEQVAKWDGTFRYPNSVLSQKEIDANAIFRQPLIQKRPINFIRNVALPRDLALKVAKGLKVAGGITMAMGVADNISKGYTGNITWEHAATSIGVGALGLVADTFGAPVVLGAIAVGVIYSIYEDDLWHDYDKSNATNFIEKKE